MGKVLRSLVVVSLGLTTVGAVSAQGSETSQAQQLRQAAMLLIGNDFGYMHAMIKGDVRWNDGYFLERGRELGALGQLDLLRGFVPGSFQGQTRAKPDIQRDREDFATRMYRFEDDLQQVGSAPDAQTMKSRVEKLAGQCLSCHRKYRAE